MGLLTDKLTRLSFVGVRDVLPLLSKQEDHRKVSLFSKGAFFFSISIFTSIQVMRSLCGTLDLLPAV